MTGIVKSFGPQRVLNGLSLAARPGRVYALLGPNGAGKSTTLAIALGLTRPDAGDVREAAVPQAEPPAQGEHPAEEREGGGFVGHLRVDGQLAPVRGLGKPGRAFR